MSKFSKFVFGGYILFLILLWLVYKPLFTPFVICVISFQTINSILHNYLDRLTRYNENNKLGKESEKIRFLYNYLGFPIVMMFPNYFRQIRKDSYYERKLKDTKDMMDVYDKCGMPLDDNIKDDWVECNRYLKLRKIKLKKQ